MWTVISQKRNAIPGLAKILLAGVLLACLLFAREVQRTKDRQYRLDLDRTVPFATRAGRFALTVSSRWKPLDPRRLRGAMIAAWQVPLPDSRESASFFLDLDARQPSDENDILNLINHYVPLPRVYRSSLQIDRGVPVASLDVLDIALLFQHEGRPAALAMKLIDLPDASALVLLFVGPASAANTLSFWLDEIAQTLTAKPRESTAGPPAGPDADAPTRAAPAECNSSRRLAHAPTL